MNSWKQPTPTDINGIEELTFLERAMFREILSLCQNKDTLLQFIHADRHYSVEMERGQCIVKVVKIAAELKIDPKRVRKSIGIISKWYSRMESRAMPYGLIVTVKDYDNLVKMESGMESSGRVEGEWKDSRRRANKSVETDKTDKSVYILSKFFQEKIKKTATLNDKAREKIRTRLKVFSVDDLRRAITNFSGDWWQMENNSHRPMSWFFHSDERIEGYRDMRPREAKYKTPDGRWFESKDKFLAYMESKGWEVRL